MGLRSVPPFWAEQKSDRSVSSALPFVLCFLVIFPTFFLLEDAQCNDLSYVMTLFFLDFVKNLFFAPFLGNANPYDSSLSPRKE